MRQISTVLFDLGNVIVYIDFGAFWSELGYSRPEEIAPFKDGYDSLTLQYETGYISTDGYLNGLRTVFFNKFTNAQLEKAFSCIIQQPVKGMKDLVKLVSVKCQTALVSNTNEIHYEYSKKKLDGFSIFQKHYLSYKLHIMKPAHSFYDAIIKDQAILPSRMLFVDDIAENVEAAKSAGIQAIRFKSMRELEVDFKKLGIL
jgi:glucose-1-phosphatase